MKTNRFLSAAILIAITFTNSYAYTAADVYGVWYPLAFGKFDWNSRFALDVALAFQQEELGNSWRWINGRVEFPDSFLLCTLISNDQMDCYDEGRKTTYKKVGTVAQLKTAIAKVEKSDKKQFDLKRRQAQLEASPFYKLLEQTKLQFQQIYNEHKNITKGEFESTADFNQRKKTLDNKLKDSSASYFDNILNSVVYGIEYYKTFNFSITKYDADKQIYDVVFKREDLIINGKMKMPPEIAKIFKEEMNKFSFRYKDVDLRNVDYALIPTRMNIYDIDGNEYTVIFDMPKNAKEIIFKGSELWKDNPYAKNLNLSLKEVIQKNNILRKEKVALAEKGLTDPRDGKHYKLTAIGTQIWLAENLNYNAEGSKCYNNKPENCEKYGRLYNWETALKACPSGWHLPSNEEWKTLEDFAGGNVAGKKLKAESFGGTNDYGFSALPGGNGNFNGGFNNVGNIGIWWSASDYTATLAYKQYMNSGEFLFRDNNGKTDLFSVRCLRD